MLVMERREAHIHEIVHSLPTVR
jgi:hypothetical protein